MAGLPEKPCTPEMIDQARRMCQYLGATNDQMAEFFGMSRRHFYDLLAENPELKEAVELGKLAADANVAESLYKSATGYSHADVDIKVVDGCIVETPLVKHYPPNPVSCIFWLTNRQRGLWRRKPTEESHSDVELQIKKAQLKLKELEVKAAEAGTSGDKMAEALAELIKKLPG